MAKDPRYMSFDRQYVETVTVTDTTALANGVERHRFVKRDGAYPSAGGYAAGISIYKLYGQGVLTEKGYQVDSATLTELAENVAIATTGVMTGEAGSAFESELEVGTTIQVGGQLFRVMSIASDTSATVAPAPSTAVSSSAAFIWPGTYEGKSNPSTTPRKPGVFEYQSLLSVTTTGIDIVEVDSGSTFAVDAPVYSDTSGRATSTAGGKIVLGRALDVISTAGAGQYIRVKLGNEAGAQTN
jgi:hypothetical protein